MVLNKDRLAYSDLLEVTWLTSFCAQSVILMWDGVVFLQLGARQFPIQSVQFDILSVAPGTYSSLQSARGTWNSLTQISNLSCAAFEINVALSILSTSYKADNNNI